jgi:hypothetical protein
MKHLRSTGGPEKSMKLEKRVQALEARWIADPVMLHFADGSTREIPGSGDYLLNFFIAVCGEKDLTPGQRKQVEWVRQCVGATQPGGGYMIELLRSFLDGPTECASRARV